MTFGFEKALSYLKDGKKVYRGAWHGRHKWIELHPQEDEGYVSYLELRYLDNHARAPWTPTRCDLLENDWMLK